VLDGTAKLGGLPVMSLESRTERLSMLLWGRSGCGKTVLASTAPGDILYLNFDPDGIASIKKSNRIMAVDMSTMSHDKVPTFRTGDAMETQLRTLLTQQTTLATVIVDSVTSFAQLALTHAVVSGKASGGTFKATIEAPGMQGYGIKNRLVLDAINMLLRVTGALNRNIIFICHEDVPKTDKEGAIQSITLLLGGSLPEEVPLKISEVWHLLDSDGRRTIGIRPYAMRSPMRTRMFRHDGKVTTFPFVYNQDTGVGDGIDTWFTRWRENGFDKIPVPR
jgi:hypothetical protein